MGFSCGIVGLPNVGKSTLFNALTRSNCEAENFPFCTIDPNKGKVEVPDFRLDRLAEVVLPKKIVPAQTEFVDIAGLVKGASKNEGLGNRFLQHIREVDAIAQVVRCFEAKDVVHVEGKIDPLSDIEILNLELIFSDLDIAERALDKIRKSGKKQTSLDEQREFYLTAVVQGLSEGFPIRRLNLTEEANLALKSFCFLTAKPLFIIANTDDRPNLDNPFLQQVKGYCEQERLEWIAVNAPFEKELAELEKIDQQDLLSAWGMTASGLDQVIQIGYRLLNLKSFFTAGEQEVRAWPIPMHYRALQAGGSIHSDFEKSFIFAEVTAYSDFIEHQGQPGAKSAGKTRLEGRNYLVQDGDIIYFRLNRSGSARKV